MVALPEESTGRDSSGVLMVSGERRLRGSRCVKYLQLNKQIRTSGQIPAAIGG